MLCRDPGVIRLRNKKLSMATCSQDWRGFRLRCGDVFGVVAGVPYVYCGGLYAKRNGLITVRKKLKNGSWKKSVIPIKSTLGQALLAARAIGVMK